MTWLFVRYFSKVVSVSSVLTTEIDETKMAVEPQVEQSIKSEAESVIPAEDQGKGQSVDFVFPELSPDK